MPHWIKNTVILVAPTWTPTDTEKLPFWKPQHSSSHCRPPTVCSDVGSGCDYPDASGCCGIEFFMECLFMNDNLLGGLATLIKRGMFRLPLWELGVSCMTYDLARSILQAGWAIPIAQPVNPARMTRPQRNDMCESRCAITYTHTCVQTQTHTHILSWVRHS